MCKVATLNINGINDTLKQMKLVTFLKNKSIDIALLQEHNIKHMGKLNTSLNITMLS